MSLTIILLAILLNLCIFNIIILDLIESFNQLNVHTNYIISLIHYKNNNSLIHQKLDCKLDCKKEIHKITYFYDNISQFKDVYIMLPMKIQKITNKKCLILYINKPIINNKYNTTNMIKDKRMFTFKHNNNCKWYINDMSSSLCLKPN
jgi:hypothetical protein